MDANKITFILCKEDPIWYEECIRYIQEQHVPGNYSMDILSIEGAESTMMAYDAAMDSSDARYKVYLRQDTFILNKYFIRDILKIFNADPSIGMIGMIGYREIPDGSKQHWSLDAGRAVVYNGIYGQDLDLREEQDEDAGYSPVSAIDGSIMVTQYDLPWQEHSSERQSYDILHSLKMRSHGKKVVVPWQEEPWCYHCQGAGGQKDLTEVERLQEQLIKVACLGDYDAIWAIIDEVRGLKDKEICSIADLAEIYILEKASCGGLSSGWWQLHTWEEIYRVYNQVRFALIRMGYRGEEECIKELKAMVECGAIHKDAILYIANTYLPSADYIFQTLLREKRSEPLVSVILPVYNGAEFVGKTIESILGQTYKNLELIIIDDASTDHSREVIQFYSDPRIRPMFNERNRNVVYSSNIGFKAAKGKYIALIGHDDLWKPDKLEKQVAFLEDHPSYGVCFSCMDIIDEELSIQKSSFFYNLFSRDNRTAEAWIRKLFMKGNLFCAPSACIRKSLLDKVGYYRYALVQLQDYDLWLRLFLEGEVYIYPEILTFYRKFSNGNNLSVINVETQVRSIHEQQYVCRHYIERLPEEKFRKIFSKYMKDADAQGEKEILCEKAIFLWNHGNGISSACDCFAELFEDEECRRILEEKYQMDLGHFYKLNALAKDFR